MTATNNNVQMPPQPASSAVIEQRVRMMIGDLMVTQAALMVQLEECQKEIAELKERRPTLPAKAA